MNSPLILLAVCVGTVIVFGWFWLKPHPIEGIPHLPIVSRLGDIPRLRAAVKQYGSLYENGSFMDKAASQLGPVFQGFLGPFMNIVVVSDAEECEDVLTRGRGRYFEQSDLLIAAFSGLIPQSLIALKTDSDAWRRHRRATSGLMGFNYHRQMTPAIVESAERLVDFWWKKAQVAYSHGATSIDFKEDLENSTLDNSTAMVLEKSADIISFTADQVSTCPPFIDEHGGAAFLFSDLAVVSSIRYLFKTPGGSSKGAIPWIMRALHAYDHLFNSTFKLHYGRVIRHIDDCLEERRAAFDEARRLGTEPPPVRSLLGMLVEQENDSLADKLSDQEARDEALAFLFAGQDTTAAALQWGLKFLADNPEVQRTLRSELQSAWGDFLAVRSLTYEDLTSESTPYLDAVVAEILRCARVVENPSRVTTAPMRILGHDIPEGTQITFAINIAANEVTDANEEKLQHRNAVRSPTSLKFGRGDRGLWSSADVSVFNPSRWLLEGANGRKLFNPKAGYSFPFGLGPRSCAGQQLAQLTLKAYIATLNIAFFLDSVPPPLANHRVVKGIIRSPAAVYLAPRPWPEFDNFDQ